MRTRANELTVKNDNWIETAMILFKYIKSSSIDVILLLVLQFLYCFINYVLPNTTLVSLLSSGPLGSHFVNIWKLSTAYALEGREWCGVFHYYAAI